jgi:hypothetical protein
MVFLLLSTFWLALVCHNHGFSISENTYRRVLGYSSEIRGVENAAGRVDTIVLRKLVTFGQQNQVLNGDGVARAS